MSSSLSDLNKEILKLQTEIDQASGRVAAEKDILLKEYGCKDLAAAQTLLKKWDKHNERERERLNELLELIEEEVEALRDGIEYISER